MKALGFKQLKAHPLSKFWFSDVFNLHPYSVAVDPAGYGATTKTAHVVRRCRLTSC